MRIKLLLSLLGLFLTFSTANASFPVKRTQSTNNTEVTESSNELSTPAAAYMAYDKWVAVAFWFFLGIFAAHRWYARKPTGWNILYIVTLGGLGVWAIVDLINILTDNFQ